MKKIVLKKAVTVLYLSAMAGAGLWKILSGETITGTTFLGLSLLLLLIKWYRHHKKTVNSQQTGLVIFDERDVLLAGKAALFTVRLTLHILALFMLAVFALNPSVRIPLMASLGIGVCLIACTLQLSFMIMKKRE